MSLLLTAMRGNNLVNYANTLHLTFSVLVDDEVVAGSELCEGLRTGEEDSSSCD